MDKSCHSSGDSTTTSATSFSTNSNNRDQYLRHLNKYSYTISKPIRRPAFNQPHNDINQPPPPPEGLHQEQHQHQPPVYNINKSDFRDLVQKLTGSPTHGRFSAPPPIQPPKPPSSRLQRIRPPPLAQISKRPPPLLNNADVPCSTNLNPKGCINTANFGSNQRPLSPLPPFPAVHSAAESPISAYMRYLQNSISGGLSPLAPLISPKWNNLGQPQPPQNQHHPLPSPPQPNFVPSPTSASMAEPPFPMPTSPLPFGCLPSPRSPYPLLSPSLLFSPATTGQFGFQQFPLSPRLPVSSPMWKDL